MTAADSVVGPVTWAELHPLCAKVRQLLISMDFEAGDIQAAAVRVLSKRGGAAGLAYKEVRELLAEMGQDIDQPSNSDSGTQTARRRRELNKALHSAARYGKE